MDNINNGILHGFKKKNFPKKKVYFIPIEAFKPTIAENKMISFYTKLMGYHFKWSHDLKCPVVYNHNWKRHCMVQKDGASMYVVYGDKKEYLEHVTNTTLTIINKYAERKRMVKNKLKIVKTGLSRPSINNLFGINLLNI